MVDADSLYRRFGHLISHHIDIAALLSSREQSKRPCAYAATDSATLVMPRLQKLKTLPETHYHSSQVKFFTNFLKIAPLVRTHPLH